MRVNVWLLAPLLLAQLSLPTVVLCRGSDGHVALEWSHEGQCAPESRTSGRVEIVDRGHCGECIDSLVFIDDPARRSHGSSHEIAPPTPTMAADSLSAHTTSTRPNAHARHRSMAPISPVLLRSVVLLI